MARIYESQGPQTEFYSSARSIEFNPVRAVDQSQAIREQNSAKLQDLQAQGRAAARQVELEQGRLAAAQAMMSDKQRVEASRMKAQQGLDSLRMEQMHALDNKALSGIQSFQKNALTGAQSVASARLAAEWKVAEAKVASQNAVTNGLLQLASLSTEFAGNWKKIQEQQKVEMMQEMELDFLMGATGLDGPAAVPPETPQDIQREQIQGALVQSEAVAINKTATEIEAQGGTQNASLAHQLRQGTALKALEGIQGNVYAARSQHRAFLQAAIDELPDGMQPKTYAEAAALMRQLNKEFFQAAGLMGLDRQWIKVIAPTLLQNTETMTAALTERGLKMEREANKGLIQGQLHTLVQGQLSGEDLWNQASNKVAFGNMGFNGHSAASNEFAIRELLAATVATRDMETLERLAAANKVPGNDGTKLGTVYANLFAKAREDIIDGNINNWNREQKIDDIERQQSIQFMLDNPSVENKQRAIDILKQRGDVESLEMAARLQSNLHYDPEMKFRVADMQRRGIDVPQADLDRLLTDGKINAEEHKALSKNSISAQAREELEPLMKAIRKGVDEAIKGPATAALSNPAEIADVALRTEILMQDLQTRVEQEIKANPALLKDKQLLGEVIERNKDTLLKQPQYQFKFDPKTGKFGFDAPLSTPSAGLSRVTVAPGVQDYSSVPSDKLFGDQRSFPRAEMNPSVDRFLSREELKADVKAVLAGQKPSNKLRLAAKHLGLSEAAIIDGQLKVYGLGSLELFRQGPEATGAIQDLQLRNASDGMRQLQSMGFPRKGAAYLAGNIQQESGWNGTRTWGEVAGDGSDRNGGLVSWMDDAQRNHYRLRNIEQYLGKPIQQATHTEQLAAMKWEMQRRNPDAYRVFMNPNSSDADLRRASYQYWGFGHEGGRYKYATNLLKYGRI